MSVSASARSLLEVISKLACENCGLPEGVTNNKGLRITITRRAENNFKRDTKAAVWVCSRECGIQASGVSQYGASTHKWPVTLAQYRATGPLRGIDG